MNNEDLVLKMILDESGFKAGIDGAVKKLNQFDGQVDNTSQKGGRSLGGIWDSFVGNFLASGATKIVSTGIGMITSSIDSAINRVDTLNNSNRVFENMGFSAGVTSKTIDALKDSINGLPTPLDGAIKGLQLIASSTNDLEKSEQIFSAINNGILGFGGTADMVDNAIVQLSQSFSNGLVDAQTWNSMINSGLGPALNAIAKQMGLTAGELKSGLSKGKIEVTEFQDALIDLNKNGGGGLKSLEQIAQDSTSGIKTGIANMKTAVVRGVAEAITKIDEGLAKSDTSISQILADIGSAFENGLKQAAVVIPPIIEGIANAFKFLKDNGDWLIPVISGIVGAMLTMKTVSTVVTTFTAITTAVQGAGGAFALITGAINWPIVAIGALIAIGVALYKNWDEISAGAKIVWGGISDFFKETFSNIKNWFSDTWTGFKDKAKSAAEGVQNAWSGTKEWFGDLWTGIKNKSAETSDSIKDKWKDTKQFFSEVWNGVKDVTSQVWDEFKTIISPYVENIMSAFSPLTEWFSGLWESIKTIATSYWEIIKTAIMGPILLLIDLVTGDFDQFKEDLAMIWETISTNALNIFGAIKDIVVGFTTAIVDTATIIWGRLKNAVITSWNETVTWGQTTWENFKTWFTTTIDSIVTGTINGWNNLVQGTKDKFNATVNWSKETWESFKTWIKTTVDNTVQGAIDGWNNLVTNTKQIFNDMVTGAKNAWNDLTTSVEETVQAVKDWFAKIGEIDLWEAGKAIIDGFISGLKSKWEEGKEFIGGIGDWIRDHKGPIEYDRKLLVNNGMAIMDGLNSGIKAGFEDVKGTVNSMAGDLSDEFDSSLDSPTIQVRANTTSQEKLLSSNKQTSNTDEKSQSKGDVFNINLQSLGELSEIQLMRMAEQLVKYITEVKARDEAARGGAYNGA